MTRGSDPVADPCSGKRNPDRFRTAPDLCSSVSPCRETRQPPAAPQSGKFPFPKERASRGSGRYDRAGSQSLGQAAPVSIPRPFRESFPRTMASNVFLPSGASPKSSISAVSLA